MHAFITALGWAGAAICVVSYGLVSRGTWTASSRRFQVANVVGALLLCVVAARAQVWASVAANVVWAGIGTSAIAALMRARRAQPPAEVEAAAMSASAVDLVA